MEPDLDP